MAVSKTTLKTYFQTGDTPTQSQFASLIDDVARTAFRGTYPAGSVIVEVGDSNTDDAAGRPDWQVAVNKEWLSLGGIFYGCTHVNLGLNGAAINDWAGNIGTATALTDVRGNPNSVVNNAPDLIIVSLGTNELWSAARRAGIGVEATMQSNFDTLIQFFLDNTDADIWLRMPAPFAQPNFWGDWADADACAASSEQLRRVHLAWKRRDPRVRLFDSHAALWGYRVDDRTTALDDEVGGQLHDDDLHRTAIGYRREAQAMAEDLLGASLKPTAVFCQTPASALTSPVWSETVYLSAIESGGTVLNLLLDPIQLANGVDANRAQYSAVSSRILAQSHDALRVLGKLGATNRLYDAGGAAGSLKCFCHNSGNIYSMTSLTGNVRVTATPGQYYDQASPAGLVGGPFVSDDIGPITFWVEDLAYAPNTTKNLQYETLRFVCHNDASQAIADGIVLAQVKFPYAFTGAVFTGYATYAPSGGICGFMAYKNNVPIMPFGLQFADGSNVSTTPSFINADFAAGDVLGINGTEAHGARGVTILVTGKRVIY